MEKFKLTQKRKITTMALSKCSKEKESELAD